MCFSLTNAPAEELAVLAAQFGGVPAPTDDVHEIETASPRGTGNQPG